MRKQNYQAQMKALKESVGKPVTVEYVWYGSKHRDETTLRNVTPFVNVEVEGAGIPFIGYGSAIQRITGEDGQVLYQNTKINDGYDVRGDAVHRLKLKCFGSDAGEKLKHEQPTPIRTTYLRELLEQDKLTQRQFDFVKMHDNSWMGRGYALSVVQAANELYDLVRDVNDKQTLDTIAGELVELSNHSVDRDSLSKPEEEYNPISKQIMAKLDEQGHSGNSYFWALRKFIEVVAERKAVEYTPKPGLKNGAVLVLEQRV